MTYPKHLFKLGVADADEIFEYEVLEDGMYRLTEEAVIPFSMWGRGGKRTTLRRYIVYVNEGFVFSPSAPDWIKWFFDEKKVLKATLVHDFLYRFQGELLRSGGTLLVDYGGARGFRMEVTRLFADRVFRELIELSSLKSTVAYWLVRAFGVGMWLAPYEPHPMDTSRDDL